MESVTKITLNDVVLKGMASGKTYQRIIDLIIVLAQHGSAELHCKDIKKFAEKFNRVLGIGLIYDQTETPNIYSVKADCIVRQQLPKNSSEDRQTISGILRWPEKK